MSEGSPQDAVSILRPWLGGDFVERQERLLERVSLKLAHFHPQRDTLQYKAQELDSLLFMAVREDTKGRMTLKLDNGQYMRIRVEDFAILADELLYLLLRALPKNEENFRLIRDYSMRQGSLSALRALYRDFLPFQTEEELRILKRVITTCHPPFRWRGWLEA